MTRTLGLTEARAKMPRLLDDIQRRADRVVITRNGKPAAVMMDAEEFESWVETLELLSDPKAREGIREGLRDLKAGRVRSFEEVVGRPPRVRRAKP